MFVDSLLSFLKRNKILPCKHIYCYRSYYCTRCNKLWNGEEEPEWTPHFSDPTTHQLLDPDTKKPLPTVWL